MWIWLIDSIAQSLCTSTSLLAARNAPSAKARVRISTSPSGTSDLITVTMDRMFAEIETCLMKFASRRSSTNSTITAVRTWMMELTSCCRGERMSLYFFACSESSLTREVRPTPVATYLPDPLTQ